MYYFLSRSFPVRCKSYVSIVSIDTQPVPTVLFASRNVHPECITMHCSGMCGVDTFMWAPLKWEIGRVPLLLSYKLNYLRPNAKAKSYRSRERWSNFFTRVLKNFILCTFTFNARETWHPFRGWYGVFTMYKNKKKNKYLYICIRYDQTIINISDTILSRFFQIVLRLFIKSKYFQDTQNVTINTYLCKFQLLQDLKIV